METKEQLQKLVIKKWRRIQSATIVSAVVFGIFGFNEKSPIIAGLACGACMMALAHEWLIHSYIPEYNCDELRKELGRKSKG